MSKPAFELIDVSLKLHDNHQGLKQILSHISFSAAMGDAIGVVGGNGSGKSTLLRVLHGIIPVNSGKVELFGHRTALLSLSMNMNPNVSGRENALMNCLYLGFSRQQAKEKLDDIQDFSGLQEWFEKPVNTYSTGMRARLNFSIAQISSADIMLVDEVLSVGDKVFQEKSRTSMLEKIKNGSSVVLVSHNLNLISELCSTVIWIESGCVKEIGSPTNVIDSYRNSAPT